MKNHTKKVPRLIKLLFWDHQMSLTTFWKPISIDRWVQNVKHSSVQAEKEQFDKRIVAQLVILNVRRSSKQIELYMTNNINFGQ